jgi:hypothetical protein
VKARPGPWGVDGFIGKIGGFGPGEAGGAGAYTPLLEVLLPLDYDLRRLLAPPMPAARLLACLAYAASLFCPLISPLLSPPLPSSRFRSGTSHLHAGTGEEMGYFQPLGDPGYDVEGRGNVFTLK